MSEARVECLACKGAGFVSVREYGTGAPIAVKCKSCEGRGYFVYERYEVTHDES